MARLSSTPKRSDFRLPATAIIWGCATAMLAICLPLTDEPHQGNRGTIISLAILAGATVSTVAVWQSANRDLQFQISAADELKQLQERVIDLEAIASAGQLEWQRQPRPNADISGDLRSNRTEA
ncbi:hypothetical protein HJG54_20215 [Leptolyngbya sp. NK1-12]|uniref:Uncharacterized protein n=1 Tax=Leptolyngbya sp. NK1-12 TaxID=2547451 RepID=A0AA96WW58_9CYAN|nr:hypothetical protein [Leptolyngbya sp. NK1-12]WNZ24942.1 hypothetical protein HJG54_20215 [Leptolyngbya sp. NK1-12]